MRVAIVGVAVMFGLLFGVAAVGATRDVFAADPAARDQLLVAAAGAWLKVLGTVGLYVSTAVSFRDWATFALPFAPTFGSLGPRRELRRARRQIDGHEGYDASEVPRLQAIARYRLALVARSTGRSAQVATISLISIFVGDLLQPLDLGHVVLERAFGGLAIVMIVVLLASLPFTRRRSDEKALLFLARTSDAPGPGSAREDATS